MIELTLSDGPRRRVVNCEAMLFDMDGTLVDSTLCVERTWREWAARHALDAEALLQVAHGRQNHETIRLVAPHLDTPEENELLVRAEEASWTASWRYRARVSCWRSCPPGAGRS